MIDGPTALRWPVRLERGQLAHCEQGSDEAVLDGVARIGAVEMGELQAVAPWMGLPSLEGRSAPPNVDQLTELMEDQEPDADVTVLRLPDPGRGEGWETLRVEVDVAGGSDGD